MNAEDGKDGSLHQARTATSDCQRLIGQSQEGSASYSSQSCNESEDERAEVIKESFECMEQGSKEPQESGETFPAPAADCQDNQLDPINTNTQHEVQARATRCIGHSSLGRFFTKDESQAAGNLTFRLKQLLFPKNYRLLVWSSEPDYHEYLKDEFADPIFQEAPKCSGKRHLYNPAACEYHPETVLSQTPYAYSASGTADYGWPAGHYKAGAKQTARTRREVQGSGADYDAQYFGGQYPVDPQYSNYSQQPMFKNKNIQQQHQESNQHATNGRGQWMHHPLQHARLQPTRTVYNTSYNERSNVVHTNEQRRPVWNV